MALPSNFRDDWETNLVLFETRGPGFNLNHCDPKAGIMLWLTMGKNSQEHAGSNSLSQELELLVLQRGWGSLDTMWLICNIMYSMKSLQPRWDLDLGLLNPRRKCWLWNNLNSPTNCFSGNCLILGMVEGIQETPRGTYFCANLFQRLMQRMAGGGAGLLWNHWFKDPTLLWWLLSEPIDFALTSLEQRGKVANIFLVYSQN